MLSFTKYVLESMYIFSVLFVVGKMIDTGFKKWQMNNAYHRSFLTGLLQLLACIVCSYVIHMHTSNKFSDEMQITTPTVLFSSFLISLQSNMYKNFEIL